MLGTLIAGKNIAKADGGSDVHGAGLKVIKKREKVRHLPCMWSTKV